MKIGDQKLYRKLKNQAVRRGLQDNKVPGTSVGTRVAEAPGLGVRVCCKIPGREAG